jgi:tetratricopeptide (TPR) repeat protein
MQVEKTVFISYRRTNVFLARAVYQNLTVHGYDAFLDYESVDAGSFEQIILRQIAARAHFLLILTPSALERCITPDDWLRREIEAAVEHKRNIVPLMFESFEFRSVKPYLVGRLELLPQYNAIRMPADFFEEAMTRLRERFLSKPLDIILHPTLPPQRRARSRQHIEANVVPSLSHLQAEEMFEKGFSFFMQEKMGDAIHYFTEALRLNPDFGEAYYRRGIAHLREAADLSEHHTRHSEQAECQQVEANKDFEKALQYLRDDPRATIIRALLKLQNDLKQALVLAEESVRRNPSDADPFFVRGYCHLLSNNYEKAIKDFNKALHLYRVPSVTARMALGWTHYKRKDYVSAGEEFSQAIIINPG